jgi:putative membrane protein
MTILWLKALHLIFMVTWFAGLFYLPRLFVYHSQAHHSDELARFKIMEKKLLWAITTPGGVLTVLFGTALILQYGYDWFATQHWLHVKLLFVAVLIAFHLYCIRLTVELARGERHRSERFYRLINEIPVLPLIAIVLLAVLRPF